MSIITSSKARIAALAAVALATGSVGTLLLSEPAEAIPTPQRSCADDARKKTVEETAWSGVNSAVTIDNGKVARKVVVDLNVDAYASDRATILVGWKVDNGPIQLKGARAIASKSPVIHARHIMVVLDVPAGKHRIQPFWRISGRPGHFGILASRCLTAEAYTS